MRVIENPNYTPPTILKARGKRIALSLWGSFKAAWRIAFPTHLPDDPDTPSHVAKSAVLREGAILAERVDAVAKERLR